MNALQLDSVCRLVFQFEGGRQVGHIAVVTDSDPERGIFCEVITISEEQMGGDAASYWLPHIERGMAWDWLRDVPLRISYLEDEESDMMSHYEAECIDTGLQDLNVLAAFQNGDEPEWVSLIEDDWSWLDCEIPDKEGMREALQNHRCNEELQEDRVSFAYS